MKWAVYDPLVIVSNVTTNRIHINHMGASALMGVSDDPPGYVYWTKGWV